MKVSIFLVFVFCFCNAAAQKQTTPSIGVVASLEQDSILAAAGYPYLVESVARLFSPKNVTDEQFEKNLARIRQLQTQLYAVNIFLPADLKVVGPAVDESALLSYAEKVFARCREADVKLVIWGSSGSRRLPEGFDKGAATAQFISIAKKFSTLAARYHVTLALENLNRSEANFITTASEALAIVKQVNHPAFKLCADIYHMMKEGEPAAVLLNAKGRIAHCDLAEKDNRTPPGVNGDDFRDYLRVLKKINYKGVIVLECRWDNLAKQAASARLSLQKQLNEVWSGKKANGR